VAGRNRRLQATLTATVVEDGEERAVALAELAHDQKEPPMERILEPELMDDDNQARAYAQADFSTSNQWFVDQLLTDFAPALPHVIDLGCGPADVLIRLARAKPDMRITGIDGSTAMIKLATAAVRAAELEQQITLIKSYIPGMPLEDHAYDAILSKDFLHHLPNPMVLWNEAIRLGKPRAVLYVMDLIRPATAEDAQAIVERVAAQEDPLLKQDFYHSLCAAFTVAEVEEQLRQAGLTLQVQQVSERHMLIKGTL
jgi:ubiquinone/menaquinone biosynthesis C-methylase UbiE